MDDDARSSRSEHEDMYGADVIEDVAASVKMANGSDGINGYNGTNGPSISVPADPEAKLLADDELASHTAANTNANANGHANGYRGEQQLAASVFVRQLRASLVKRTLIGSRDRKAFVCQLLLPSILVCAGLLMLLVRSLLFINTVTVLRPREIANSSHHK